MARKPSHSKCRAGCPADQYHTENRRLKDQLDVLRWGIDADINQLARDLSDTLDQLTDLAHPAGSGTNWDTRSDRTKASLAVRAPTRTPLEHQAHNAHKRLIDTVQHAITTALAAATRDPDDEHETPQPVRRPTCPNGCLNNRGRPRRQAPGDRYCPGCTHDYQQDQGETTS